MDHETDMETAVKLVIHKTWPIGTFNRGVHECDRGPYSNTESCCSEKWKNVTCKRCTTRKGKRRAP